MLRIKTTKEVRQIGMKWLPSNNKHSVAQFAGTVARAKMAARPLSLPQEILWTSAKYSFGDRVAKEYKNAVPGRRFRVDIAFPDEKLAIEVDGWEHHGKYKADFHANRERQNLFTLYGWRILRFTAGEIRKDPLRCINLINDALK